MTDPTRTLDDDAIVALADALRPAPFDPARRRALRERVLARAAQGESRSIGHIVRDTEGSWQTLLPGLHVKVLRRDRAVGNLTALWKLDPGASIPAHRHRADEECLVVSGRVRVGEDEFGAGDYLLSPAGTRHPVFAAPGGAVLLIRGEDAFALHAKDT